jgi:hypothetical protein
MTPTKPFAALLIALLLTACDAPGAGGYAPDAYSANGTAAAFNAQETATAVSANSTRAAADYLAAVNGTATAVQVTATAAAIGTAKAQITNAEAIVILEQAQIENERKRAGIEATADHDDLKATKEAAAVALEIQRNIERANRAASTAVFWQWARWAGLIVLFIGSLVGIAVGAYFIYYRTLYEDTAVYDSNRNPVAFRSDYRTLPANTTTIIEQRQPAARPQALYVDNANGHTTSKAGSLPAPDTSERLAINVWLMQVLNGAPFNRTSAGLCNIGSDRADLLIKSAIRQGYAEKGEGQTSPVIPRENFGDFIDKIIGNSPHPGPPVSNLPSPN